MKNLLMSLILLGLAGSPAKAQLYNRGASINISDGTSLITTNGVVNTAAGFMTVNGILNTPADLVNTAGATLSGDGQYFIGGDWTNSASFLAGGSTLIFTGIQNSTLTSGDHPFYKLVLTKSSGNSLLLDDGLQVNGTLEFQADQNYIILGDQDLQAGDILGYEDSRYVRTSGQGALLQTVDGEPVVFPVGDSTYNPAVLSNAGIADLYSVRVADAVRSYGFSGSAYAAHAVNRTWFLAENTPGGSDLSLDLQWNGNEELTGFDRTMAYVSQFDGDTWDQRSPVGATGADPYILSRTGINAPTPFAVVDDHFQPRIRCRGRVQWKKNEATGVKNTMVTFQGDLNGTTVCDADGNYELTLAGNGKLSVIPAKDDDLLNGITVGDALVIEQHLKGVVTVTDPYTYIAMDVDHDDTLSTLDPSLINQILINNPEATAYFNQSWRFVPQDHALSSPPWGFPEQIDLTDVTTDQDSLDFYGLKVGDVAEAFADPLEFRGGSMEPLVWRVNDQMLEAGQDMRVTFTADFHENVAAFQFGLRFDPQYLQLGDVEQLPALPLGDEHFGLFEAHLGEFRAAWAHHEGFALPHGAEAFHLYFRVLQSGRKLSEVLGLDEALLPGLAYNKHLESNVVQIFFTPLTATKDQVEEVGLLENWPNPFSDHTQLRFYLPKACRAQIRVFDESGRELWQKEKNYPAGYSVEQLQLDGISTSGTLICELAGPFGTRTTKLLRLKR